MEHKIFKCSDLEHDCGHCSVFGHTMYRTRTRIRMLFIFRTGTKKVYRLRTLFSGLFYFGTPSVRFSDTDTDIEQTLFCFRTRTDIVFHKRTQIRIQYGVFGLRTGVFPFRTEGFWIRLITFFLLSFSLFYSTLIKTRTTTDGQTSFKIFFPFFLIFYFFCSILISSNIKRSL